MPTTTCPQCCSLKKWQRSEKNKGLAIWRDLGMSGKWKIWRWALAMEILDLALKSWLNFRPFSWLKCDKCWFYLKNVKIGSEKICRFGLEKYTRFVLFWAKMELGSESNFDLKNVQKRSRRPFAIENVQQWKIQILALKNVLNWV